MVRRNGESLDDLRGGFRLRGPEGPPPAGVGVAAGSENRDAVVKSRAFKTKYAVQNSLLHLVDVIHLCGIATVEVPFPHLLRRYMKRMKEIMHGIETGIASGELRGIIPQHITYTKTIKHTESYPIRYTKSPLSNGPNLFILNPPMSIRIRQRDYKRAWSGGFKQLFNLP